MSLSLLLLLFARLPEAALRHEPGGVLNRCSVSPVSCGGPRHVTALRPLRRVGAPSGAVAPVPPRAERGRGVGVGLRQRRGDAGVGVGVGVAGDAADVAARAELRAQLQERLAPGGKSRDSSLPCGPHARGCAAATRAHALHARGCAERMTPERLGPSSSPSRPRVEDGLTSDRDRSGADSRAAPADRSPIGPEIGPGQARRTRPRTDPGWAWDRSQIDPAWPPPWKAGALQGGRSAAGRQALPHFL